MGVHPEGRFRSHDAKTWTPSDLPASGLNSGYQKYVAFGGAVYALGTMTGNCLDLHLTSRIARTHDFHKWEVAAEQSNLPPRVLYGAVVHRDRIWLLGGFDGKNYYNDGQPEPNPNSKREAWSSADGVTWTRLPDRGGSAWGGSPIVFDGKLWLIAANRNSTFAPSLLVTDDGAVWREDTAPWSPRGAPAVWIWNDKLYMAGGKYSVPVNGQPQFTYRSDIWAMARTGAR